MLTHLGANLALTLTKLVLRTKDLIFMLLDGLEVFLGVGEMSRNSSKLQMAGGWHIYERIAYLTLEIMELVYLTLKLEFLSTCLQVEFLLSI